MSFFVICGVDVCVCVWGSGPRGSTPPIPPPFFPPYPRPLSYFFRVPPPKIQILPPPPPPPLAPAHLTPLPHFSSKAPHPHPLQNCCRSQIAMPHLVFSGTFPCYSQRSPGSTVFWRSVPKILPKRCKFPIQVSSIKVVLINNTVYCHNSYQCKFDIYTCWLNASLMDITTVKFLINGAVSISVLQQFKHCIVLDSAWTGRGGR